MDAVYTGGNERATFMSQKVSSVVLHSLRGHDSLRSLGNVVLVGLEQFRRLHFVGLDDVGGRDEASVGGFALEGADGRDAGRQTRDGGR